MHHNLMQTYSPLDITPTHGDGVFLFTEDGSKYLDALAGIAVTSIGHSHPKLIDALVKQSQKLIHSSNILTIGEQVPLAEKLCSLTNMDRVFFCNSGAEANECAIKIARMHGHNKGIDIPTIIVMENAFHGRTLATLTASGSRKVQAGFEPLVKGFVRAPFNDLAAIKAIAENNPNVVAVLVEPIQGESGVRPASPGYLSGLKKICYQNNWLLMLDEVQTGIGRTGTWFAYQHDNELQPDVITSAKALGNGIPIGACLAKGDAANVLKVGNHGSTYGGNPLACVAAMTVLKVIEEEGLLENVKIVGEYLKEKLINTISPLHGVVDIRAQGLMIGIELAKPCRDILQIAAARGLLFSIAGGNTIRLVPPLILTKDHVDTIIAILQESIQEFFGR